MKTECSAGQLEFHGLGRRAVVGEFDGGKISSDSGGLLLREVEKRTHILKRLAGCFMDHRDPDQIEHSLESLIKQRVMGLALGYEDLNDHDTLRHDPLLALLSDREIDYLEQIFEDAQKNKALVERNPKWQKISAQVVSLYKEITEKALENEKNA